MRRRYITAFILWLSLQVLAYNFCINTLPTQQQLPVASVHCLIQDSEGYMWYGTESGLCRDNGYQIDVFRPTETDNPQKACQVNCIAEDGSGNILFGTADGLFYVDKTDYRVKHVALGTSRHFIEALFVDNRNHVWIGVKGRIFECDNKGKVLGETPCQAFNKPVSVASFFEDSQGTLYVLQWRSGILRKHKNENAFLPLQWPLSSTPLQMVEDTSQHCFWVLTKEDGIQRMVIEDNVCRLTAQPATTGDYNRNRALYMLRDSRQGLFWTTTHDNLYAYSLGRDGFLQEFPLTGLLPSGKKILDQMCQDKYGNLYVAGYTPHTFVISSAHKDITRLSADAVRRYTGYPLLADRSAYDGHRYIWIWQGRQGLMLYDRENDRVEPIPIRCDRTIQRSSSGGIWASKGNIVFRLWQTDGNIRQEEVAKTQQGSHIRCLYEKNGDALYIGTDSKLYSLALIGGQFSEIASLPSAPNDMAAGADGTIYLALGANGLCKVSPEGKTLRVNKQPETFLSVCTMADGSVWASTHEGNVYCHTPADGRFTPVPLLCSANQAEIRSIRTDGLGHVWTLTNQQVCEYAPQSQAFRTFRNTDTFVDVDYFYAIEPIDQSRMCIDGAGALIEVQSSAELGVQKAAHVQPRLTAVIIGGEKRFIGRNAGKLHLSADEEDFTLELSTLDHRHASSVSFAYRLDGVQDRWVYLTQGTNSVTLTNMPKGNHRLRVMATDQYGLWSLPADVITIQRAAHWWETWWAYLLYISAAIIIATSIWWLERRIHLLRRLIHRKEEVRLDEIEMKREDITEQQFNDEFLRRAITKIEEHLSEPDYNVESLSTDMHMSRITFYRRLQKQTGQTPTDFIRDIRLKKAAQLLSQSSEATVADIARKVGFATPKYFSRCFKEKFGMLPKEYQTRNEERQAFS